MKRNWLYTLMATAALLASATIALAQKNNTAMIQQILNKAPSQPDVEVDNVSGDDIAKCFARDFHEGGYVGNEIVGPDGNTTLRVLCRREQGGAKDKAEQIRYYRNGIEVFREDYVEKECRWLGDAGSRRGARTGDEIVRWTYLTPEEATAEMVAALVTRDEKRFRKVALSKEDLSSMKLTGSLADEMTKQVDSVSGFKALADRLAIPSGVKWAGFNGNHPALLPQGRNGMAFDLPVYYNATVVLMNPDDPSQSQQLYIGDMVKIGDVWKIVGLPAGEPFGQPSDKVTIASVIFPAADGGAAAEGEDNSQWGIQLTEALEELDRVDPSKAAPVCEKVFNLYMYLGENMKSEQSTFIREAADFLQREVQSGRYPGGVEKLAQLYDLLAQQNIGRDLLSFVRYCELRAEYSTASQRKDATDRERYAAEEDYLKKLAELIDEYPRTPAAAEALMYLAQDKEYVHENDAAISYYTTVSEDYPQTTQAQRAAGALKRLSAVGKPYRLPTEWKYSDGSAIQVPAGNRAVIFGWASWMNPSDFSLMKQIMQENPKLTVIGVALEGSADTVQNALRSMGAMPWKTVFVPSNGQTGTEESPAALELGAQNAPLIILLDEKGTVLVPNIVSVEDLENRLAEPQEK